MARSVQARQQQTALLAFLFLGVIWGSNFIFMKWAAEEISPAQIVLLRAVFGFLPVFLYALSKRALRWQHIRHAHHFIVMSLLATAIYYFAFAKGTALLPSSIAGLLSGAIPLFTFVCAWLFLSEEHINVTKAAGVALGFFGVLLIARPWSDCRRDRRGRRRLHDRGFSQRRMLLRLCPQVHQPAQSAGRGADDLPNRARHSLPVHGDEPRRDRRRFSRYARLDGLVLGLGLCGTGLAYLAYYYVVANLGAVAASGVTYIPPVVALVIGAFLVGDEINPLSYVAMMLILFGVRSKFRASPRGEILPWRATSVQNWERQNPPTRMTN